MTSDSPEPAPDNQLNTSQPDAGSSNGADGQSAAAPGSSVPAPPNQPPAPAAPAAAPDAGFTPAPDPAFAAAPARPARTVLNGVGPRQWVGAAISAAIAYGVTVVGTIAALVLVFIGSLFSADSAMDGRLQEMSGVDTSEITSGILFIIGAPFQVAGLALMGSLNTQMDSEFLGTSIQLGGMLWMMPLLLTALASATLWWLGRRAERGSPTTTVQRWLLAGATGVVLAVIATLLAQIFTIRSQDNGTELTLNSASASLFFGAILMGTLASFAGRRSASGKPSLLREKLPDSVPAMRLFGLHFLTYTTVTGFALLIAAAVKGGAVAAFAAPLWLPTAAAWSYGLGHLSAVRTSTSMTSDSVHLFTLPWWVALLMAVLTLLLAVCASVAWSLMRPRASKHWSSWATLPAAFLAGGLLLALLSAALFDVDAGILAISGSLALAPWTFLIMGLWGAAIEAGSRFVAPTLVPLVPVRVRQRLGADSQGVTAGSPDQESSGAQTASAGPVVEAKPMTAQTKKRLKVGGIIVGAVVVLSVGATVAYNVAATTVYGPQAQVEKYLDALKDGDAEAAVDILDPNVTTQEQVLLNNEIFKAAENRISGYEIRDIETTDDGALVTADITQDSKTVPITFALEEGDRTALVFNEWRVLSGAAWHLPIEIPGGEGVFKVNGVDVELSSAGQQSPLMLLPVLPGDYVITPPEGTKYVTLGEPQTASVSVDPLAIGKRGVQFEINLTDAVQKDAIAQAKAYLEKCVAAKEAEPESCPNRMFTFGDEKDYRNISWKLSQEPTYEVSEGWQGTQMRLNATDGEATVTYERNTAWDDEPAEWEKEDSSASLYFSGDVVIEKDKLTVSFED